MFRHPFSEAGASSLHHTSGQPDGAAPVPPSLHSAIPPLPPPAIVGNVDRFEAIASNFNQVHGNQENHTIQVSSALSVLRRSPLTSPSMSSSPPPAISNRSQQRPRTRRISEFSHYHALLRMFGNISHKFTPRSSSRSSKGGIAVALSLQAHVFSSLLTESTPSCSVLLTEAAGLADSIRQAIHRSRYDTSFVHLAEHCCTLVSAIMIFREQEGHEVSPQLITSIMRLVKQMQPIANFLTTRRGFRETVRHVINREEIAEHRDKLMKALAEFGTTNFSLEGGVAQINMSQDDLIAALKKMASQAMPSDDPPSLSPTSPPSAPVDDTHIPSGSAGATGMVRSDVQGNQINVSHSQNISMTGGTIVFGSLGPDAFTSSFPGGPSSGLLIPSHAVPQSPGPDLITPERSTYARLPNRRKQSRQIRAETLAVPSTSIHHTPLAECTAERSDSPTQLQVELPDNSDMSAKPHRTYRRRKKTVCWYYATPGGCRNGSACNFRHGSMASPTNSSSPLPSPSDDRVIHDSKD